ncbi:MAG TPA: avidin/streptavidin family protein [Stellaceae bacterium]|nr:avidin/streptavidin family protein [Stellaceae bacterium]
MIALAYLWLAMAAPARAQAIWTWTNEYGSILVVTTYNGSTGQLSGTYTNEAPDSCDRGKPQGMTGWLATSSTGTAISFTVNFLGCNSTTVWTGQLNNAAGFQGLWLLSLAAPVTWNGVSAGADTFVFKTGDKAKLMAH